MQKPSSTSGVVTFVLSVAVLAWIAGFGTAIFKYPPFVIPPAGAAAPKNFGLFNEAWALIRSQFYGHIPTEDVITTDSIEGVVSALKDDPYAAYISAATVVTATQNFEPAWVPSAGIWILPVARGARVLSIDPAGPAAKMDDLTPGDTIALTDDQPLGGLGREALVKALDGKAGTKIQTVVVPVSGSARAIEFLRVAPMLPEVTTKELPDGATLLRLPHLERNILPALDAAIAKVSAADGSGLVLDLRDNPGGPLADLPVLAARFLEDGVLYTAVDKAGAESPTRLTSSPSRLKTPQTGIVVLVNDGTYGTAEILAAALRDGAGARLVGEHSGGAFGLQSFIGLGDGSQLRLTTAHWKSRAGILATAEGLKPDVQVTAPRAETTSEADPQLGAALSVLKEKRAAEWASR